MFTGLFICPLLVILLILLEKALNLRVKPFSLQRFQLARLLHHQKV